MQLCHSCQAALAQSTLNYRITIGISGSRDLGAGLNTSHKILDDSEAILESITDAFFAVNDNWQFTYVNREAEKILDRSPGELLGKGLWDEYPGLAGSQFESIYRKVAAERETASITAFYPAHERWYEVHVYPAAAGISAYFKNVTKRMQADERLRESELRFRLMADAIPQIVWITDAQGHAEFFNRQWSAYTGVPFEPSTVQTVSAKFIHPDDQAPTMTAWNSAMQEGRTFVVEHRVRSASGEYRWFLVRAEAYRDPQSGEILRWFGTSTDVHDRKLTEHFLQKSEARYRSLFQSIDEGFCIIKILFDDAGRPDDYRFCEVNPVFERQTGLHKVIGKSIRELVPEHETHWYEIYGRVAMTGEAVRFENEAKGLGRWYDVYAFQIDDPAEHKVAVLFTDITNRRHAEEELRLADRRKDEFLAMLAHELRNPLAPIGAAADLLRFARLDDERVRQTSEIISRQVAHMTSLVDDLLDVSRVTRGRVTLDKVALDAKHIVSDAVEQVRPLIEARRHRLALHMSPEPAFVFGDQKRLVQVVSNILNNAAKYTPEGGGIVLRLEVEEQRVLLAVADNGIGMAPALVSHIFELFSQGERTSDRSQGGLGIGLALVRSLAELHHGSVSAHSDGLGKGSEFIVSLPRVVKPDEPPELRLDRPVPTPSQRLRIMVIDDNADAACMLAMYLEAAGHDVIVEHKPIRALERAIIEIPDVCLIDIGLPDMDGNELARRLRLHPATANLILVAVTGYGHEQDKTNAATAGFDHYFVKPVDTTRLAALLSELNVSKTAPKIGRL
jgi:PAS domain S-box-containing protein